MLTIVGTVKTSITFENTTKYYLVVADGEKVIFHGTKDEAQNVYDDPESTKGHSLLEIVAPGGKTSKPRSRNRASAGCRTHWNGGGNCDRIIFESGNFR